MDVAIAIEIGCERRRATPLFRLEELAQFGGIALIARGALQTWTSPFSRPARWRGVLSRFRSGAFARFRCGIGIRLTSLTLEKESFLKSKESKILSAREFAWHEHDFNLAALHRA